MNSRHALNRAFSHPVRIHTALAVNNEGDVLSIAQNGRNMFSYYADTFMYNPFFKPRFILNKNRFAMTRNGLVVVMLTQPMGVLIKYPDGTKRFIADSWYESSYDESIDWTDEMAEHLTVAYANRNYIIFRSEIRISGAVWIMWLI